MSFVIIDNTKDLANAEMTPLLIDYFNRKKLVERWFWGIIIMLWLSLLFGHFSTNYIYSGTIGYELNEFLIIYIGNIGVISILLFKSIHFT